MGDTGLERFTSVYLQSPSLRSSALRFPQVRSGLFEARELAPDLVPANDTGRAITLAHPVRIQNHLHRLRRRKRLAIPESQGRVRLKSTIEASGGGLISRYSKTSCIAPIVLSPSWVMMYQSATARRAVQRRA